MMTPAEELVERLRAILEASELDVSELLDSAWADAQDRVHATLTDAFAEMLLERSLRTLGADQTGTTDAPSAPTDVPTGTTDAHDDGEPGSAGAATYLFGVVPLDSSPPADVPPLPGGSPPRLLPASRCAAVVADVDPQVYEDLHEAGPQGLDVLAAAAHAHDAVLASLAAEGSVLPLRLGTVLVDDAAVTTLLDQHADDLTSELHRLADHAEWAVTVHVVEGAEQHSAPPTSATDPGRDYLQQRRQQLDDRNGRWALEEELAEAIHTPLAARAVADQRIDSRPLERAAPPLLHGVYLVRNDDLADFEVTLEQVRSDQPRAVIEISGPWPPYHFSHVELGAPEEGSTT